MIRRILFVIGLLLILLGASEVPFASFWIKMVPKLLDPRWLSGFGIFAVILGAIFMYAAVARLVGLRWFMFLLGSFIMAWGIIFLANQNMVRDLFSALMLNRTHSFEKAAVWISGLIRIGLGALVIYAVVRRPARPEVGRMAHDAQPMDE